MSRLLLPCLQQVAQGLNFAISALTWLHLWSCRMAARRRTTGSTANAVLLLMFLLYRILW